MFANLLHKTLQSYAGINTQDYQIRIHIMYNTMKMKVFKIIKINTEAFKLFIFMYY